MPFFLLIFFLPRIHMKKVERKHIMSCIKKHISLFKEEKRNYERKVKTFLLMEKKWEEQQFS